MNLACKQCGYENETQRVYCHNCGAKLDRSVLPEDTQRKKNESPGAVRKRVRNFGSPGRFTLGRLVKMILSAVVYGFIAAALIAAALPPHDLPKVAGDSLDAPAVPYEIEDALAARRSLVFSEDQLNAYLARAIRARKSDSWTQYKRTFVQLKPREVWTSIEYTIFQHPIYLSVGQSPKVEGGKLTADYVGGRMGRLPIPAALMPFLVKPFATLADALKNERQMLGKMQTIQVSEKKVVLIPGGPQAPPAAAPPTI